MSDVVIQIENLSKQYRLGLVGTGTLSHDLNRWWHGIRGKEDPYLKVTGINDRTKKRDESGNGKLDRDETGNLKPEKGNGSQLSGLKSQISVSKPQLSGLTPHPSKAPPPSDYVWALKDINLEVKRGEVLGIIGRNGAGKSTLLKILSRITAPTTGQVNIKGRTASLLEVGTGFHPELTGRENIYLNGAIMGMTKAEVTRRLDEIVDFSGCERYIDTPVKRYSSGMMVRLGFAVAAHLEPEILIVDEVLAVGDAEFQKKCLGKMQDVAGHGRTVLFVSHNMGAIASLCSWSILLNAGRVLSTGLPDAVVSQYLRSVVGTSGGEAKLEKTVSDAYFVRIAILDNSYQPTQSVQVTSSFKMRFEYQVVKPIAALEVSFSLFDRHGSKVFYSGLSKDEKARSLDFEPGHYVADVDVPANFLAPGMYSVSSGLHQPNTRLFDRRDHVIGFSVLENGSSDYRYSGQDIGSILVQFDWTVERRDGKS